MNTMSLMQELSSVIRDIPDFPKKGIMFKDITPLLKDPRKYRQAIDGLAASLKPYQPEAIVSMEARGFLFGAALAYALGIGFVPVRKKGKLPSKTYGVEYALEYGKDTLEIHVDALTPGEKCVVVDDVLATGGTAAAVAELVSKAGGKVTAFGFLIELSFLDGRKKISSQAPISSLITY